MVAEYGYISADVVDPRGRHGGPASSMLPAPGSIAKAILVINEVDTADGGRLKQLKRNYVSRPYSSLPPRSRVWTSSRSISAHIDLSSVFLKNRRMLTSRNRSLCARTARWGRFSDLVPPCLPAELPLRRDLGARAPSSQGGWSAWTMFSQEQDSAERDTMRSARR